MGITPFAAVMIPMAAAKGSSTLASSWSVLWGSINSFKFLTTLLVMIGMVLVVWAIVKMIMAKIRNRPMDGKQLVWAVLIGAFLIFPNEIITAILNVADSAIGVVKDLLTKVFKN